MSTLYQIPLTGSPQHFAVTLGGANVAVTLTYRNLGGAGWCMSIDDGNGVRLVSGIPLVTGIDLLSQYKHLGIPGALYVVTTDGPIDNVPTFYNLGTGCGLYYLL